MMLIVFLSIVTFSSVLWQVKVCRVAGKCLVAVRKYTYVAGTEAVILH